MGEARTRLADFLHWRARLAGGVPDPELVERGSRRRFTAAFKLSIVREADRCSKPGEIGAVCFHRWTFDVNNDQLEPNTSQLRHWMDANRFGSIPLDINEFGACDVTSETTEQANQCVRSMSSADWGSIVASYTE